MKKRRSTPVLHSKPSLVASYAEGSRDDYSELISRIVKVYKDVHVVPSTDETGMWDTFFERNEDLHHAFMNEASARPILDDPGLTNLFYGFDNLMRDFLDSTKKKPIAEQDAWAAGLNGSLTRLAEALGAVRLWNPETGNPAAEVESDVLLDAISNFVGAQIEFPNPFPDEFGLMTGRGLVSHRAVDAIYQAFRIKQLSQRHGGRVVEIGAGLGRTAYYAYVFGVRDYTIIDLPFTNVAQANFLGRVLPRSALCLHGEPRLENAIKILPASSFPELEFDVVANVDSLTEMVPSVADEYIEGVMARAKVFWSVNHEVNPKAVMEIPRLRDRQAGRFPYWLRAGYVEEIYLGDSQV